LLPVFARTNNLLNRLTEGGKNALDLPLRCIHQPNNNLSYPIQQSIVRPVQFGPAEPVLSRLSCIYRGDEPSQRRTLLWPLGKRQWNMIPITKRLTPKLRKAPQPPLSHAGAIPDSDRAKRPPLSAPPATGQELTPGDRVEGLGNFGKPTGEIGTVERANEEDAVVKWDDDGRTRLHQPSLKKI
jgi:hypothetical protein